MTESHNTSHPPDLRPSDRRQAERAASVTEPRFPATGTERVSALLAAARQREYEARLAAVKARRQPIRPD
jgi:hypothetical protein